MIDDDGSFHRGLKKIYQNENQNVENKRFFLHWRNFITKNCLALFRVSPRKPKSKSKLGCKLQVDITIAVSEELAIGKRVS